MTLRVAIAGRKGGVGKTTIACGLGAVFAAKGRKTLVVDLDPQSNVAFGLGTSPSAPGTAELLLGERPEHIEVAERLHVLPGSSRLVDRAVQELEPDDLEDAVSKFEYDAVVFDCPPGEHHLERFALAAADTTLVIADAHLYALVGAQRVLGVLASRKKKGRKGSQRWALVMSRVDRRRSADKELESALAERFPNVPRLVVRQDVTLANASMDSTPITQYAANCRGIEDLTHIIEWLDGKKS